MNIDPQILSQSLHSRVGATARQIPEKSACSAYFHAIRSGRGASALGMGLERRLLVSSVMGSVHPSPDPKLAAAIAMDLESLGDYACEGIVSRILVSGKAGSVTLFAFDQGQQLSEHTAPFDALVQVLRGEAQLTVGGKPIRARVGQVVLMPSGVPHSVKAEGRFKMLLTMIRNP